MSFSRPMDFYFAYTQTAWFQSYNQADSRPFRDVDYQPDYFIAMRSYKLFGRFF